MNIMWFQSQKHLHFHEPSHFLSQEKGYQLFTTMEIRGCVLEFTLSSET